MTEEFAVRPIAEEEFTRAYAVDQHAFHTAWPTEPEMRHFSERLEFDRTLAAFDGPAIIGVAAVFSFRMSVPGAIMPAAGVTAVSVLPSYRRRGVLRSLMTRQLGDIHDRGEAIAALWASESGIYGRFGYGAASKVSSLRIRRGEGQLAHGARPDWPVRLRIVEPRRAVAARPAVAARHWPFCVRLRHNRDAIPPAMLTEEHAAAGHLLGRQVVRRHQLDRLLGQQPRAVVSTFVE